MSAGLLNPRQRHQSKNGQEAGKNVEEWNNFVIKLLAAVCALCVLCHVLVFFAALIFECGFSFVCILGGQQPAGQQSRGKDYRTAQEEQFLPLHAPVRRREMLASTIALTVSPTGMNWTEHTL